MRRWMVVSAVILVVLILGSGAGYVTMKLNRPDHMWVPLLLNSELPEEKREQVAAEIKEKLLEPERLEEMARDLDLVNELRLASPEDAVRELEERIFVRVGEAATPMGLAPALHVGVSGKRREREMLGKMALRLTEEVGKILEATAPPPPDDF